MALVQLIERFFRELDSAWRWPANEKVRLRIIGSTALMLQTSYERGTKDSDVLETLELTTDTKARLLEVGGEKSPLYRRLRMYIEIVSNGLPFLPQVPRCHLHTLELKHFEIEVLDVVDVVVSKLKRFSANDIGDIKAMVDLSMVTHDTLIERFQRALDFCVDSRGEDVYGYIANLHRVERDYFDDEQTRFDLPSWLEHD